MFPWLLAALLAAAPVGPQIVGTFPENEADVVRLPGASNASDIHSRP